MVDTNCSPENLFTIPPAGNGPGSGEGGTFESGFDSEIVVLCDGSGPFQRRIIFDSSDGSLVSSTDFTLSGAPYTTVGRVSICDSGGSSYSYETETVDVSGPSFTILPAGDLISWVLRNRTSTTGTFQINGGSIIDLDSGETIGTSLSEESVNFLADTVLVDPGDGIVRITTTRRV